MPVNLAESDCCGALALAPATKNHRVAIFKEGTLLVCAHTERLRAALAQFDQGSRFGGRRARLRAAAKQVSGAQIAAIDGVVGDQLPDGPVRMAEARLR